MCPSHHPPRQQPPGCVLCINRFHKRSGHLWQGRFESFLIAEDFGVGGSAVSHAGRRVEQRLEKDRKLRSVVEAASE